MSQDIAIYSGSAVLHWSALVITLGLLAALFMTLALQRANRGPTFVVFLFFALSILFSVPLCRILHWYCHTEQYSGLLSALRDYSTGSYVLPGAMLGVWLAAYLATRLDSGSCAALLDAAAPGLALVVAFIRLSAQFNASCRSKISVLTPILQHLPLASGVTNSAGQTEYRFATYFVHFLLMLLICWWLLHFFFAYRRVPMRSGSAEGNVIRMFLLAYSATEMVLDSTRYDSSFLPFNGFISFVQIVAAASMLGILIYYSVHSVRAHGGVRAVHWVLWIGWFLSLAAGGFLEYLVQRHGDWYLPCYLAMALCCVLMMAFVYRMYLTCCKE